MKDLKIIREKLYSIFLSIGLLLLASLACQTASKKAAQNWPTEQDMQNRIKQGNIKFVGYANISQPATHDSCYFESRDADLILGTPDPVSGNIPAQLVARTNFIWGADCEQEEGKNPYPFFGEFDPKTGKLNITDCLDVDVADGGGSLFLDPGAPYGIDARPPRASISGQADCNFPANSYKILEFGVTYTFEDALTP